MFIQKKIESTKATLKSTAGVAQKWTKRIAVISTVAGVLMFGATIATIKVAIPHVHNIYSVAKLIVGEARGESHKGQKAVFATLLVRKSHALFPNTMHDVAYQPYSNTDKVLQYNAMGDTLHEDLSTELGQLILARTAWWYVQAQLGIFVAPKEAAMAHSYCVPAACARQKGYFGELKRVGQIGNHVFYADCDEDQTVVTAENTAPTTSLRPKMRLETTVSPNAPKTSPRPKARSTKQSAARAEQVDQLIAEILLETQ